MYVLDLQEMGARMFGKEAALFLASGTQANLAGVMTHCSGRFQEVILGNESHILMYEQGGVAGLGGILPRSVVNRPDGTMDLKDLEGRLRSGDLHQNHTALIALENTHNRCHGSALPLDFTSKVYQIGQSYGVNVHVDGARICNAAVAQGVSLKDITRHTDTLTVCLSKGLGAPIGTLLLGPQEFIDRAKKSRKILGGAMRQTGIIAAGGIYALSHNVAKLADDHRRAFTLAQAINKMDSDLFRVNMKNIHSNMVFVDCPHQEWSAAKLSDRLATVTDKEMDYFGGEVVDTCRVKASRLYSDKLRFVTYLNINDEQIELACEKLRYVAESLEKYLI